MSRAGLRRKRAGVTSDVYIAHGRYCTERRIPLLLIECTPVALDVPSIKHYFISEILVKYKIKEFPM